MRELMLAGWVQAGLIDAQRAKLIADRTTCRFCVLAETQRVYGYGLPRCSLLAETIVAYRATQRARDGRKTGRPKGEKKLVGFALPPSTGVPLARPDRHFVL